LASTRAVLDRSTDVAMDVGQQIPKAICLTHVNCCSSTSALRVIRAEDMTLEPRYLLELRIGAEAKVFEPEHDPSLSNLKSVGDRRKSAVKNCNGVRKI